MSGWGSFLLSLSCAAAVASCVESRVRICDDGTTCPTDMICGAPGECLDPANFSECGGRRDGDSCDFKDLSVIGIDPPGDGVCHLGICQQAGCGNWVVEIAELCDDGNTESGDGCSGDCKKLEECGDLRVDAQEDCDDGNDNPADGCDECRATAWSATALVAGALRAADIGLDGPAGVAADLAGNLYIADSEHHLVRRLAVSGVVTTVAGTGEAGFSGDYGGARYAELSQPRDLEVDSLGNVFVLDSGNQRLRRIDAVSGTIETVVATDATGLAVDALGNVYLAEDEQIRRWDAVSAALTVLYLGSAGEVLDVAVHDGKIYVVGAGQVAVLDGVTLNPIAALSSPTEITVSASGSLHVVVDDHALVMVDPESGMVSPVAGDSTPGFIGDGGPAAGARFSSPAELASDASGRLFIADSGNDRVRVIDSGMIDSLIGGTQPNGDGHAADSVSLQPASGVLVDSAGNAYFADANGVRRVDGTTGVIDTVAQLAGVRGLALGSGTLFAGADCSVRQIELSTGDVTTIAGGATCGFSGDGGPADQAQLEQVRAIGLDGAGNIYVSEGGRVRKIAATDSEIDTIASVPGLEGIAVANDGDVYLAIPGSDRVDRRDAQGGSIALFVTVTAPTDLAVDAAENLAIAAGSTVWLRETDGDLVQKAGNGAANFNGDGGPAVSAEVGVVSGVALQTNGDIYLGAYTLEPANPARVQRIDAASGNLHTIAGAVSPEGMGPRLVGRFADPRAIAFKNGDVFVAGGFSGTVQRLSAATERLSSVVGRYPQDDATLDRARFGNTAFGTVGGVAVDPDENILYVSETSSHRIHAVHTDPVDADDWTIAILGGQGVAGFADGLLEDALFRAPTGLHVDGDTLYVADTDNHIVRAIDLNAETVTTIAGTPLALGFFGDGGLATDALLHAPVAVTRCGGDLFIADTGNHRIRRVSGTTGTISTVLMIESPSGLDCDDAGNLYVSSPTRVELLTPENLALTIYEFDPFGGPPAGMTACLTGLAVVSPLAVRVVDACTGVLVELTRVQAN